MAASHALLHGPIARQLVRLAWPVLIVLALQTLVGVAETYFVSFLGTDALAGVALVFPVFMLMTMMSNGGIGGGVSSAVARALGAGRRGDTESLATHGVATVGGRLPSTSQTMFRAAPIRWQLTIVPLHWNELETGGEGEVVRGGVLGEGPVTPKAKGR
jgi:Na+-driven multidrug efflux pump